MFQKKYVSLLLLISVLMFIFTISTLAESDNAVFGMSLILDGKIGIKVTENADAAISDLYLDNVEGTDNFVDFGSNNYAVFYVNPKDAVDTVISFDVVYTEAGIEKRESISLTIPEYVSELKSSTDDEKILSLVKALETYYTYVHYYFDNSLETVPEIDLTAEEISNLYVLNPPKKSSKRTSYMEFNSSSLVFEEDTAIRHYFELKGDILNEDIESLISDGTIKVEGTDKFGLVPKENLLNDNAKCIYVEIPNISSNELSDAKTVTITCYDEYIIVKFSALNFVQLSIESEDSKLRNLSKALYLYSAASDAYNN